jgi:hypothetical protein
VVTPFLHEWREGWGERRMRNWCSKQHFGIFNLLFQAMPCEAKKLFHHILFNEKKQDSFNIIVILLIIIMS